MGEEDKTVEQQSTEFDAAFEALASNLREPGEKTPEQLAADKAASTTAKTPEQIAAEKKAADDAAAAAAATKTPEQIAAEKKAADDAAAAAVTTKTPEQIAADKKVADDAAAAATAAEPTEAEKLRSELAAREARIAELEAARTAVPPAKTPEQIAAEEAAKKLYTADEEAFLKEYNANWETVSKGEELKRRAEYNALVSHIFQQVQARYEPVLAFMEEFAPKTQLSEIQGLVPDYVQVRDPAVAWAQKQSGVAGQIYKTVIAEGTPQEVADMIEAFKKATGYKAPAAAPAPAAVAAAAAPAAPAANDPVRAGAVAALKPVGSERTGVVSGPDPNDFNSAFAEFATASAR